MRSNRSPIGTNPGTIELTRKQIAFLFSLLLAEPLRCPTVRVNEADMIFESPGDTPMQKQ